MIGQYADMEHIGISEYHPGSFPYSSPFSPWCITIKGGKLIHLK